MIPRANLQAWTQHAPWPDLRLVEQDLIICRALCDLFNAPALKNRIAFRGGTAINKLLFRQPLRYSEDIDLVQVRPERIGPTIDAVRGALSWLGDCHRERADKVMHLIFRFVPETAPETTLNLKIEINTREHVNLYGLKNYHFGFGNPWYEGRTDIVSFQPEEIFGTKLRALLQRNKGRDLFDLSEGLRQLGLDGRKVVECFAHYLKLQGLRISRAEAEERMLERLSHSLTEDIDPLLPAGVQFKEEAAIDAFGRVWKELIARIDGLAWKLTEATVKEIREKKYPGLLK